MAHKQTGIHSESQVQAIMESDSAVTLLEYLSLMEDTETPRTFLIWSLIAAAAGLLGRNSAFYSGPNHKVTPNLFVILLGPVGIRKSTPINYMRDLLGHTSIHFGPSDTGGQRHGLMSALTGLHRSDSFGKQKFLFDTPLIQSMIHPRPPTDMTLFAPELGRLMGAANREMADFMLDMYDGAQVDYQTKAGETRLRDPLITLLGGTTSSSLATILPENAVTHGILSRMVFIYADKLHKSVPLPPEQGEDWQDAREQLKEKLYWIDANRNNFCLDSSARKAYVDLYDYAPFLEDPRLESYRARRSNTLIKVAMALAALRQYTNVIESDILLAHELLHAAEPQMHRALEHFGRNRIFQGRMLMLSYLRRADSNGSASHSELRAAALSELNEREANEAISAMLASGELRTYGDKILLGTAVNEITKSKRTNIVSLT